MADKECRKRRRRFLDGLDGWCFLERDGRFFFFAIFEKQDQGQQPQIRVRVAEVKDNIVSIYIRLVSTRNLIGIYSLKPIETN